MIKLFNYFLPLFISCMSVMAFAQTAPNFHLYLLAGQSNMAGRGEVSGKYRTEGSPRVYMLNKNNEWVLAKHPLHFDKPTVAGAGPGLSFGLEMAKANPDVKIGLVPCAVGGTSINTWKAGGYDKATKTHPYDDALIRIREAMKSGVFKGIIWHQGESDSAPEAAAAYFQKLADLIGNFREIIKDPDLPFVAGELGTFKEQYKTINSVLRELPGRIKHTAIASSKGLEHKGDITHFDSSSAEKLGKRFAKQMRKIQKR
ncbi:MAG: sialate O-acetylesterase [Daejeonella sp.]